MAQEWEYDMAALPMEHGPEDSTWLLNSIEVLNGVGSEAWEAVLVMKREQDFVHVLMKRPKVPGPSAPESAIPIRVR